MPWLLLLDSLASLKVPAFLTSAFVSSSLSTLSFYLLSIMVGVEQQVTQTAPTRVRTKSCQIFKFGYLSLVGLPPEVLGVEMRRVDQLT
mmetsp:Transcript_49564/g.72744  ORF Transcript_49564/g.72744 Transcript_49564/m.72744 type:complete len:89 (+) Transcript_49564:292-558(+)